MSNKLRVGILFGGKSAEHEVSLQSAKNVIDALDQDKYEVVLIGIDKQGSWLLNDTSQFLLNSQNPQLIKLNQSNDSVTLVPQGGGALTHLTTNQSDTALDVVFPILHGPYGEDGTVQGLLKLAGVPFVGSGILGAAVGMDKEMMKRLLRDADLPVGPFLVFRAHQVNPNFADVAGKLGLPLFVKPANLGSSVGVNKVTNEEEFRHAVADAFQYDRKILVEAFIEGREIECSVLGNDDPIASVPGEVIATHEFYSYEAKYIDENGAALEIPAKVSAETARAVQDLAVKVFTTLGCEGLARVDFFLCPDGELVVNEVNTMPGFTSISMYPRLWEESGIPYAELIDRLIRLAIERFEREQRLKTTYQG
ncbi:D-alanine--D-alanine ligase [Candidatus Entotheonella palauensis]|uniref:D-alanine--D-alanine ligase n=1 Tax=Candidatus Entotheonella palauensis TaxID=93172 RepID=UPI000B7F64A4|nr:D-alanine--D-alanine ligase [Candidatus Entotheonella palauensis]